MHELSFIHKSLGFWSEVEPRGGEVEHTAEAVVNLVGKTNLRDLIRLVYHAEGVLCPVTFAMHLGAAVETKPGRPMSRPCVVVAGGREPRTGKRTRRTSKR